MLEDDQPQRSEQQESSQGRKISLYNGDEKVSDLGVHATESNRSAIKRIQAELKRSPVLTHAVFRDRKGTLWTVERGISLIERAKIELMAE